MTQPQVQMFDYLVTWLHSGNSEVITTTTRSKARWQVARHSIREFNCPAKDVFKELTVRTLGRHAPLEPTGEERLVADFNAAYPVGQLVSFWSGLREGPPSGFGPTKTQAMVLGGHTAVVWIEGARSCIALSHVEPLHTAMPSS